MWPDPQETEEILIGKLCAAQKKTIYDQRLSFWIKLLFLYNNKYMIASTQIINTEILIIAVLVFELLSRKDLFMNRKRQ